MRKSAVVLAMLMLSVTAAGADWFDECEHKADRRVAAPVSGAQRIVIVGRAGSLKVDGRAGVTEVVATGTACASESSVLNDIRLVTRREGTTLRIEAEVPENRGSWFGNWQARLDFTVVVPAGVDVKVTDGSGSMEINEVGNAEVIDGSGEMNIRAVRGNLTVRDGSGSIEIDDVTGDVRLEDGSGSIDVRRVNGAVVVEEDGSGSIEIRDVKRGVTVEDDGSGSITVSDVGGDFVVDDDGSGGIDYSRVSGTVRVPRDRRGRH